MSIAQNWNSTVSAKCQLHSINKFLTSVYVSTGGGGFRCLIQMHCSLPSKASCTGIFFFQIRYRALIEKVASTQEVHVLYVDFGNVSLSIVTVYCSLIGGFMSSSFWLLPPLLP